MSLPARLRQRIAVGACSGAELWGYSTTGERNATAFYTADSALTAEQRAAWRIATQELITEFHLIPFPPMPISDFRLQHGEDPWPAKLAVRAIEMKADYLNAFPQSNA